MWDVLIRIGGDDAPLRLVVLQPVANPTEDDFQHAVRAWLLRNRGPGISFDVLAVRSMDSVPEMAPFAGVS